MARPKTGSKPESGQPLEIGGGAVAPGRRGDLEIRVARLPTGTWLSMPVTVINGARPGPRLWLSAAIHGDELNGVEIVNGVLRRLSAASVAGAVIAVPIVNVFGFVHQDRYLPDRRDLNRSFPGSPQGSLAARLAHLFMQEVVSRCSYGIDLHTGSHHRANLPQIRADLSDAEASRCATAFGAPVMIDARVRDGSLREAAARRGAHVLVFEGGEALRFDREVTRVGVQGVLRVLAKLGMIRDPQGVAPAGAPLLAQRSRWLRARRGGVLYLDISNGDRIHRGQRVGSISGVLHHKELVVRAPYDGLVIGKTTSPLVYQGDAIVHVAEVEGSEG